MFIQMLLGFLFLATKSHGADSDATLTDDVENTKAMNQLKKSLLASSDSDLDLDSDPPPRVFHRRLAKLPPSERQRYKNSKSKRKPLTTAEKHKKTIKKLLPEQRR